MCDQRHFKLLNNFCRLWSNTKRRCVFKFLSLLIWSTSSVSKSACRYLRRKVLLECLCCLCLATFTFFLNQSYVCPVGIPSVMEHLVELWFVTLCFDGCCITISFADDSILRASVFCSDYSIPIWRTVLDTNWSEAYCCFAMCAKSVSVYTFLACWIKVISA